jgi:hypothetical protein
VRRTYVGRHEHGESGVTVGALAAIADPRSSLTLVLIRSLVAIQDASCTGAALGILDVLMLMA